MGSGSDRYKFKVSVGALGEAGFAKLDSVTVPCKMDTATYKPGETTASIPVPEGDNAFTQWLKENCGPMMQDVTLKDRNGIDIEHWVFKKWVKGWVARILLSRWVYWLVRRKRHWFFKRMTVFKNCYPVAVKESYDAGEDVTIQEVTLHSAGGEP